VVGIVLVSHSSELATGLADLARQMAGPDVTIEVAGGGPDGRLGTDGDRVRDAIRHADTGDGVVVLGDIGSAFLTIRHVLERMNGRVRLVDAPFVEGTVSAAVVASVGSTLDEVAKAAEEARGANKL
jgi:phosphoenolpyruvate---glycerone phosphotransferase subunit DhaM